MTAATAAIVRDGDVVGAIVVDIDADRNTGTTLDGTPYQGADLVVLPDGSPAGIGWTYVDGEFIAPPLPPEPDPTDPGAIQEDPGGTTA